MQKRTIAIIIAILVVIAGVVLSSQFGNNSHE